VNWNVGAGVWTADRDREALRKSSPAQPKTLALFFPGFGCGPLLRDDVLAFFS
jgi:hypothetical protein